MGETSSNPTCSEPQRFSRRTLRNASVSVLNCSIKRRKVTKAEVFNPLSSEVCAANSLPSIGTFLQFSSLCRIKLKKKKGEQHILVEKGAEHRSLHLFIVYVAYSYDLQSRMEKSGFAARAMHRRGRMVGRRVERVKWLRVRGSSPVPSACTRQAHHRNDIGLKPLDQRFLVRPVVVCEFRSILCKLLWKMLYSGTVVTVG